MNPILALIITNTIWGMAPPIFKFALENIPPFTLAFIRFFSASFLFIPWVIKYWQKPSFGDWIRIALGGFFAITINITFFFLGLQKTESINAAIIGSSAPVFLYFASIIFLAEKPRLKVFSGMILSLIGVLAIIFSPILFDGKVFPIGEVQGNLFYLIAAFSLFVLDPLIKKDLLKRVNPFIVTYFGFLIGSLPFIPFMLGELRSWSFADLNINGWTGIIFGVFFSSALAYFLYNYGISKIRAQEIGIFNYIDPIAAVMVAAPLLGEYPDIYFVIGAILVFGGIYLAEGRLHYHPLHKLKVRN